MSLSKLFFIIFFIPILSNAQIFQDEECAHYEFSIFNNFPEKKRIKVNEYLNFCNYNPNIQNIKYRIPIKFYIYRRSNGKDGLSEKEIKEHIRYLNYYYSTNNTGLSFYLRPDIEYIDNDKLHKLNYISQAPFQTIKRKTKGCINVYITEKFKRNRLFHVPKNFSGTYNSATGGVIIANGVSTSTLAHEIGHYFGLKHPHRNWKSKVKGEPVSRTRLIPGTNTKMCERKGDGLCDTPAEPKLTKYTNEKCVYTGWNVKDKYGTVYVPATNNIMSYTRNRECRDNFTPEQVALMLFTASNKKNAKNWSVNNKDAKNYEFDYFEPDNSKETASEIFLRTKQTHTFHKIYTGKKRLKYEDNTDFLYFKLKTTKAQDYIIYFSESNYILPEMDITVYKNDKIILKKSINNKNKKIALKKIEKGKYFIKIHKKNNYKMITGYKIKVEKTKLN